MQQTTNKNLPIRGVLSGFRKQGNGGACGLKLFHSTLFLSSWGSPHTRRGNTGLSFPASFYLQPCRYHLVPPSMKVPLTLFGLYESSTHSVGTKFEFWLPPFFPGWQYVLRYALLMLGTGRAAAPRQPHGSQAAPRPRC